MLPNKLMFLMRIPFILETNPLPVMIRLTYTTLVILPERFLRGHLFGQNLKVLRVVFYSLEEVQRRKLSARPPKIKKNRKRNI
jgi:hypothetical protein